MCRDNLSVIKNPTRITGTLHEDVSAFLTISLNSFRMRNILDKFCRENQNTHFIFNIVFPKIAVFMR